MKKQKTITPGSISVGKHLLCAVALTFSVTGSYAQWDGSSPSVNTYTTSSNVGIGMGPVTDARLKIISDASTAFGTPVSSTIPGLFIQRNLFTPLIGGVPIPNAMELWQQVYSTLPPGTPPGTNTLKFVIDNDGYVGINKQPLKPLDVAGDANIDAALTVGNVIATSADALTVQGNITFKRQFDNQFRNIRARTNAAAFVLLANTGGADGPALALNGRSMPGIGGSITIQSYGSGGDLALDLQNYDPSTTTWTSNMHISADGRVAIGPSTLPTPAGYRLYVDDGILTKKLKIALPSDPTNWSDFVFADNYELRSLEEVESYIAEHKHLPEIPSTSEVHKEGLDVAQMDAKLLQKIEELTLYVIQQQKEIDALKKRK